MRIDEMDKIGEVFAAARDVLVVTHVGPDGDAFGSLTAVGQMLEAQGKDVCMVVEDGMLPRFDYLPMANKVRESVPAKRDFDLLVAVDCGDAERMGEPFLGLYEKPPIVNIDHHVTNTNFGRFNLVPSNASSACEVLYSLFNHLGYTITQPIAVSLLTGLVTDTLCFRTPNVKPSTLQIASELIEAGADLPAIVDRALNVQPYSTLKLWKIGLNHMHLEANVAWTTISREEQNNMSIESGSSTGLSSLLGNIEEAACGAVITELDDRVLVSMRSRPPYAVNQVALDLGGGGHAQAAGCTLFMSLEDATDKVVRHLKASVASQKAQIAKAAKADA